MLQDFILFFFLPMLVLFVSYSMLADTEFSASGNFFGAVFFGSLASFIFGGVIFVFYATYVTGSLETEERVKASYDLVSLDANEDINGSFETAFFVGSGYIGEDLYYHFYYETSKGIKYVKKRAESMYIIETDGNPRYVIYANYIKDETHDYYRENRSRETRRVLYIPKGTIKRNYKVN